MVGYLWQKSTKSLLLYREIQPHSHFHQWSLFHRIWSLLWILLHSYSKPSLLLVVILIESYLKQFDIKIQKRWCCASPEIHCVNVGEIWLIRLRTPLPMQLIFPSANRQVTVILFQQARGIEGHEWVLSEISPFSCSAQNKKHSASAHSLNLPYSDCIFRILHS